MILHRVYLTWPVPQEEILYWAEERGCEVHFDVDDQCRWYVDVNDPELADLILGWVSFTKSN